jgi:hypothetical protein
MGDLQRQSFRESIFIVSSSRKKEEERRVFCSIDNRQ